MSIHLQSVNNLNTGFVTPALSADKGSNPLNNLAQQVITSQADQKEKSQNAGTAVTDSVAKSKSSWEMAKKTVDDCVSSREELYRALLTQTPYTRSIGEYSNREDSFLDMLDRLVKIKSIEDQTRNILKEQSPNLSFEQRVKLWNEFNKNKLDSMKGEILKQLKIFQIFHTFYINRTRDHDVNVLKDPNAGRGYGCICEPDQFADMITYDFSTAAILFKEEVIYMILNGTKTDAVDKIYSNIAKVTAKYKRDDYYLDQFKAVIDNLKTKSASH